MTNSGHYEGLDMALDTILDENEDHDLRGSAASATSGAGGSTPRQANGRRNGRRKPFVLRSTAHMRHAVTAKRLSLQLVDIS